MMVDAMCAVRRARRRRCEGPYDDPDRGRRQKTSQMLNAENTSAPAESPAPATSAHLVQCNDDSNLRPRKMQLGSFHLVLSMLIISADNNGKNTFLAVAATSPH